MVDFSSNDRKKGKGLNDNYTDMSKNQSDEKRSYVNPIIILVITSIILILVIALTVKIYSDGRCMKIGSSASIFTSSSIKYDKKCSIY